MGRKPHPPPLRRSERALDWLSFFVADVQTGFGPFVAVYLAAQGWGTGEIGLALTAGGVAAIASQMPGGALVDALSMKRLLIAGALAMIAVAALLIGFWPRFAPVLLAELLDGGSAGVLRVSLAAVGLGLVGHGALGRRLGRNQGFSSLGNVATVLLMGLLGHLASAKAPFVAAAALCLPGMAALGLIRASEIDHAVARSSAEGRDPRAGSRLRDAARNRHLHVFVLCLVLFQFANAALLPLAGARIGYREGGHAELLASLLIVAPQIVAASIATRVAAYADRRGRKPLLVIGLGAVGVRAVLFALFADPWVLLPVQLLDGLSAAVIGVMMPLVLADLTRGTGRYNLAQGFAGTATGLGAALSTASAGYAVQYLGYPVGFLGLAAVGFLGAGCLWLLFPETRVKPAA